MSLCCVINMNDKLSRATWPRKQSKPQLSGNCTVVFGLLVTTRVFWDLQGFLKP